MSKKKIYASGRIVATVRGIKICSRIYRGAAERRNKMAVILSSVKSEHAIITIIPDIYHTDEELEKQEHEKEEQQTSQ